MRATPELSKFVKDYRKKIESGNLKIKYENQITVNNWIKELEKYTGINFKDKYTVKKCKPEPKAGMCGFEIADREFNMDIMFNQCAVGGVQSCQNCIFKDRNYRTVRVLKKQIR